MKEDEIRRLVKIVEDSNIGQLEVTRWGQTIKISKSLSNSHASGATHAAPQAKIETSAEESVPEAPAAPASSQNGVEIKSPMVGTFYRSPAPDADPYIDVSQQVKKGQVLCIIEAMKLMNEIESDADGKIVEILVENGQPVEYNQPLFIIEPA